jgi:hypothetical protein
MSTGEPQKSGLSKEAWGAIATVAVALITAVVTLTTHFMSPGNEKSSDPPSSESATVSSASPTTSADAIAGRWSGNATDANGASFKVDVDIARGCAINARCGTISVSHVPCRGSIYLVGLQQGDFEFRVDNFEPPSAAACSPGAGEHFQLAPDGSLVYTATYDPKAHATLTRQN